MQRDKGLEDLLKKKTKGRFKGMVVKQVFQNRTYLEFYFDEKDEIALVRWTENINHSGNKTFRAMTQKLPDIFYIKDEMTNKIIELNYYLLFFKEDIQKYIFSIDNVNNK